MLELKSEARQSPMATVMAGWEQLRGLVVSVPAWLVVRHSQFWPGACTVVLRACTALPAPLVSASGGVGVRVAETMFLRQLCQLTGPLTATSANPTGRAPAHSAQQLQAYYPQLPAYGSCAGAAPSTILDAMVWPPRVLRPGALVPDLTDIREESDVWQTQPNPRKY